MSFPKGRSSLKGHPNYCKATSGSEKLIWVYNSDGVKDPQEYSSVYSGLMVEEWGGVSDL
jgi:hypothetical protein